MKNENMTEKKQYVKPEMEVIVFEAEDILTSSGNHKHKWSWGRDDGNDKHFYTPIIHF